MAFVRVGSVADIATIHGVQHEGPLGGHPEAPNSPATIPAGALRQLRLLVYAMRPRQWTKNVLVFVAPAAAGVLSEGHKFLAASGAFAIFCAAASGSYLINDRFDAAADRRHPTQRNRPIASGELSGGLALGAGVALSVLAVVAAWLLAGWPLALVVATYCDISAAYTLRLKREPVIELAAVAAGFVLRAIAGGTATKVPLSNWFLVVTCFGALFVVTGKRVAEVKRLGDARGAHRPVLSSYTPSFLASTTTLTASVTVTAYCLWAFERAGLSSRSGHHFVWIQLSVIPVILGVLYVLYLLDSGKGGAPEDLVFHERFLQLFGAAWVIFFAIGLYG